MDKTTRFLIQKYSMMSGNQKMRIAMRLSESVRKMREDGARATKTEVIKWSKELKVTRNLNNLKTIKIEQYL